MRESFAPWEDILRRTADSQPDIIHIADLEIDLLRDVAARGGERLELTPGQIVHARLARAPGVVVAREVVHDLR